MLCRSRDSVLGEGICTTSCPYRSTCQVQKISFLIYSAVIDYTRGSVYPDEYIDELVHERAIVEAES